MVKIHIADPNLIGIEEYYYVLFDPNQSEPSILALCFF